MTKEQPGANSLSDMMLEYFRRLDYVNDTAEDAARIASEDRKDLNTEFACKTGRKSKFLTAKYREHRRELKAARKRETMARADIDAMDELEAAIEGFKGLPLYTRP
jgi:hypothetical protein